MREICMSGLTSGGWKRSHGPNGEAPATGESRRRNCHSSGPTATASVVNSTAEYQAADAPPRWTARFDRPVSCNSRFHRRTRAPLLPPQSAVIRMLLGRPGSAPVQLPATTAGCFPTRRPQYRG